jgi:Camelysin metallo-endopeptidase
MTPIESPRHPRPSRHPRPPERERLKLGIAVIALLVIGVLGSTVTWSAWTTQTRNRGNTFAPGTVDISTNATGSSLFSVPALVPGTIANRCVQVRNSGTLPAGVRLYSRITASTGLQAYVRMKVTRGTVSPTSSDDCSSFTPDGSGTLFDGLISGFPSDWAGAIVDPTTSWAPGETHAYMFTTVLLDDNAAQNKTLTETLVWEGR